MPGTGSVFQRTERVKRPDGTTVVRKRWLAQVSVGPRDDRRVYRSYAPLRANSRDTAKRLLADLLSELSTPQSDMALGAYLERWVRDVRNIRPTTRHGYEAVVKFHLVPTIGHIALGDLHQTHVEQMLADLSDRMSPKSLRNVHAVLRRALRHAVQSGLVTRNVAAREYVDAPKVSTDEPRALSADEVRRLIAVCREDRVGALYVLAVGTGLRQGELLGLSWQDLDLDHALLRVRAELVYRDGRYQLDEPKTPRSRRTVPLAPSLVRLLREHEARIRAEGFVPVATGPVFVNTTGGDLSSSWVTHHLYALLSRAGVERLPFKNLRTTFGSRLFEAGVPDRTIADLLGHARTATTQKHYIRTADISRTSAVDAVEELIG